MRPHDDTQSALDPIGALWLAWLRGVEAGVAQGMATGLSAGMAWAAMWQAMARGQSPQVSLTLNLPFANGYTQTIEPFTNWGWIAQQKAGDAGVETEIVRDVASYGRQLGWLMDLTLDLAQKTGADPKTVAPVRDLHDRVETIKKTRR
jgi:hypothetical protein